MKQIIIFITIAILFAFANQVEVIGKKYIPKKERNPKIFNTSKIFNVTKHIPIRHGILPGGCVRWPKLRPKNSTNCTKGFVLKCSKFNFRNETYCRCQEKFPFKPLNITTRKKCQEGSILRCSGKNCVCKKIFDPIIRPKIELSCPEGKVLRCKNLKYDREHCECKDKPKIVFPRIHPKKYKFIN